MSALLSYPLDVNTYCDYAASFTWAASGTPDVPVNFAGATAAMMIRLFPSDPLPLVSISTTGSPSGFIVLGIAPPGPLGATVANLAALVTFDASAFLSGTLVAVTAPAAFYAWSPAATAPPDGVTVVTGAGGQWLLCGTIQVSILKAALLSLVGTAQAFYDLVVTFPNGTSQKFLDGYVYVDQTATH
jgi:hypothetical protein